MLRLTRPRLALCVGVLAALFAVPAVAQPPAASSSPAALTSDETAFDAFDNTPGATAANSTPTSLPDTAVADPWEGYNRWMFAVDMKLDDYVLQPVARGYVKVTPSWGQAMVRNFFDNLLDVRGAINALLQLKFAEAGSNLGRVLINTTMGVGGLFDVATQAGLTSYDQDFGLTLARWGVPRGPYVVLPVLGPSNVRDGLAMVPGRYAWPPHYLPNNADSYLMTAAYGVTKRADLLGYKERIIGDKYIFIRNLYLKNRTLKAGKPLPQDNFGASLDDSSDAAGW